MGFANIVDMEKGDVDQGLRVHRVRLKYEPIVYGGGWTTHAVILLRKFVHTVASIPYGVLTLDKHAFSPASWAPYDTKFLYDASGVRSAVEHVRNRSLFLYAQNTY